MVSLHSEFNVYQRVVLVLNHGDGKLIHQKNGNFSDENQILEPVLGLSHHQHQRQSSPGFIQLEQLVINQYTSPLMVDLPIESDDF